MNISPYISIIIPTYNSATTIVDCLSSISNQSVKDYEILIIDGSSTDNTIQLINILNDSKVRVVSEKDNGVYDAMNKGVNLAQGQWIYFLGSDDTLFNNDVLKNVYLEMQTNLYDVIYGNVLFVERNEIYAGEVSPENIFETNISHQAIFFRKSAFLKVGNFDLRYKVYADWDHNIRWIFSKSVRRRFVNLIVANFSVAGLSASVDKDFYNLKPIKYIRYMNLRLPFSRRVIVCLSELKRSVLQKDLKLFLYLCESLPAIFVGDKQS
jgi:glycosyltransferase involved in cell wall biosynthesis